MTLLLRKAKKLLFAGHKHYPFGGLLDLKFKGTTDECKTFFSTHAVAIANGSYIDNWGHIVDQRSLTIELYGQIKFKTGNLSIPDESCWARVDLNLLH